MAFITIWRSGLRECLLVLGDGSLELCLIDDYKVIRRTNPVTTQAATMLAATWKQECQPFALERR